MGSTIIIDRPVHEWLNTDPREIIPTTGKSQESIESANVYRA